jgi:FtsP/CotA-like multicopper oxidase with cupredoxin domain
VKDSKRLFDGAILSVALAAVLISVMAVIGMVTRPDTVVVAGDPGSGATSTEVRPHITLSEFKIDGDLMVPPGNLVIDLLNEGGIQHNLQFDAELSPTLNSGESADFAIGSVEPGEYVIFCAIPGHREAGMTATLVVDPDAPTPEMSAGGHGDDTDWEALDEVMLESIRRFPAETEGVGNQLLEPTIAADGTKEFELTAAITPWEVEPGKVVDAWTYNGMVPGPMIKIDVGDKVRVHIQNDLPMGTDIHWHGVHTPNNMDGVAPITQDLIRSGQDFTYEFVAEDPAVGMYHAHHHGHVQIPNGMFAVMLIGEMPLPRGQTISGTTIPDDLEVAQEFPMVLNDAGVIGFSLNGKSFPATAPIVVTEGDWILAHYYNEGLQIHPMHQHQFPQLIVAKDGIPLDNPYWADTVNVAPGERYSVLMQADTAGVWVWHCHILTHVERDEGMFGMVTAMVVQESDS